jgi:hypothetical protein
MKITIEGSPRITIEGTPEECSAALSKFSEPIKAAPVDAKRFDELTEAIRRASDNRPIVQPYYPDRYWRTLPYVQPPTYPYGVDVWCGTSPASTGTIVGDDIKPIFGES